MTKTRVFSALILIPIVVFFIYWGDWVLLMAITLVAVISTWEFNRMMGAKNHKPTLFLAILFALSGILVMYFEMPSLFMPLISLLFVATLIWQLFQANSTASAVDWALTIVGGMYIGLGLGHLLGLRLLENGVAWVWLALICTWAADTFAYFTGRAIGKHKFWPRHSPKKTWEGILGGVVGGMLLGAVISFLSPIALVHGLIIGAIVSIVGPLGDLSISMLKRYTGVKDSSQLIPGHGGLLDRIDSLLFVSIVTFYYINWVVV